MQLYCNKQYKHMIYKQSPWWPRAEWRSPVQFCLLWYCYMLHAGAAGAAGAMVVCGTRLWYHDAWDL